ncbi:hypothetical protein CGCF413_v012829 [Colletotrichum fructicola]|nr:hypothetical protein CFRS1_v009999 [Colletotrichum fructicola]KAF5488642.1 hypothetical protein CGCF413_v012829 [Colletotrichum fructicola]
MREKGRDTTAYFLAQEHRRQEHHCAPRICLRRALGVPTFKSHQYRTSASKQHCRFEQDQRLGPGTFEGGLPPPPGMTTQALQSSP